jgi:hypothetical protein
MQQAGVPQQQQQQNRISPEEWKINMNKTTEHRKNIIKYIFHT